MFYAEVSPGYGDFNMRKVEKNDEEDCLSLFKAGLWQMGFSDAATFSVRTSKSRQLSDSMN